jgi:hypothetical protein
LNPPTGGPFGFGGDLSNPNGPPVGGFNSITQGLSLLASFGGGPSGGNFEPFSYSPGGYDSSLLAGGFRGGSFDFNSLQASTPVQSSLPYPQHSFPQQNSGFQQSYPQQQQVPFNPAGFSQNYFQQQPQFQQPYPQSQNSFQQQYPQFQQPFQQQIPAGNTQQFQFNPSAHSIPASGGSATYGGINPAQFGTLLSNPSSAAAVPPAASASAGAAETSAGTASAPKASSSQQVEVTLASPPSFQTAESTDSSVSASAVHLIAIGPPSDYTDQRSFYKHGKKSLISKGLRSGYY